MLKHLLALLTLSIVAILFLQQIASCLHYLGYMHSWLGDKLGIAFAGINSGQLISHILALVLIPLIISLIPAFLFWLVKRSEMPHMFIVTWIVWVMLVTIIALR